MPTDVRVDHGVARHAAFALCTLAVAVAIVAAATVLLDAKVRVRTQKDDAFAFKGLRTWAWHPDGAGDVKMALTPDDDPAALRALVDPIITDAVTREFTGRGLTAAEAGQTPDLYVTYYVLLATNLNRQTMAQNLPAEYQWQIPSFIRTTQNLKVIEEGSLVLDVSAAAKHALVWRGVAQAEIHRERTPPQREARLREAIGDLFKKFPKT